MSVKAILSIEWVRRTHARMPLTPQEQLVKDLLIENSLAFETHHVFELSQTVRISVDFLIFSGTGIVLECTYCAKRRGSAVSEAKRRGTFINYRFGLLKQALPNLVCGALIEAPKEDQSLLKESMRRVLGNSDFLVVSGEELCGSLLSASKRL